MTVSETEARRLLATIRKKATNLDTAKVERDDAVRAAFHAGVPRQEIADAADISLTRIYQITAER